MKDASREDRRIGGRRGAAGVPTVDAAMARLAGHGLAATPERRRVVEAVLATEGHFDAEAFYLGLRQGPRPVSRATVYRTLDLLVQCGLVARLTVDPSRSRYEVVRDEARHAHLFCSRCGDVQDLASPLLEQAVASVPAELGFAVEHPVLVLHGRCRRCREAGR